MRREHTQRVVCRGVVALGLAISVPLTLVGCSDNDHQAATPIPTLTASHTPVPSPTATATTATLAGPGPWQRTEQREPCANFALLRRPFFGDLHVHTRVSVDAYIYGTRGSPVDAYAFARGAAITLCDDDEQQTRSARIDRPLDFTAVTDHAEWFGDVQICTATESPAYDDHLCQLLRQAESPDDRFLVTVQWLFPAGIPNPPPLSFCNTPGVDCNAAKVSTWQEIQAAAEGAYDRTAACTFTSFIGYEYTASPLGKHLHRNVIFRNDHVPGVAASYIETYAGGTPQGVWTAIEDDCLHADSGCDAVIIPHNSNLSGGQQFFDPADGAEAQRRQNLEPLVEIHQIKGNSECRFDRLAGMGAGTEDELCAFEQLVLPDETPGTKPPAIEDYPQRNLVRNVLKDGLLFEQTLGANPFKFGFIGDTDTHDGTAGNTDEPNWEGGQGNNDSSPARQIGEELHTNPGGLAVAWAEENSRDAIFAALRRRETYATSGTRPIVRFFGGTLDGVDCDSPTLIADAYRTGTPMGGDIGGARSPDSPRFAVLAVKDPGTSAVPGTDLQRVQIIKGWVDAGGETHERVYEVAGDPENGATVDPATCALVGRGASELCAVWDDPDFDRTQRAFYYARVIENPTCRWSTYACKSVGVDPFSPDCAAEADAAGSTFQDCCLSEADDPTIAPTIQERAWTSPIWYRPEAIANVDGVIAYGTGTGSDTLTLAILIGNVPAAFDVQQQDLTLRVTDDDEIYRVTIPAGALTAPDTTPLPDGIRSATFTIEADGQGLLQLETEAGDLSTADRTDHVLSVSLDIGTYKSSYTRLWRFTGNALSTGSPSLARRGPGGG